MVHKTFSAICVITNILQNHRKHNFPAYLFPHKFHTSNINKNLVMAIKSYVKQMSAIAPAYFSIHTISITSQEIKSTCVVIFKSSITSWIS
jgi:hypothetical protein